MTWLWALCGFSALGLLSFCIWWLIHVGKQIAKGEESARREGLLKKNVEDRNQYIKDVDRLSREKSEVKDGVRQVFRSGGTVGDVIRLLDRSRGMRKVPKKTEPESPR